MPGSITEWILRQSKIDSGAQPVYLIFHIQKTAGRSLIEYFAENLEINESFIHLGYDGYKDQENKGLKKFEYRDAIIRNKARVILGHDLTINHHLCLPHRHPVFITFLRDPAERTVSHYNYDMHSLMVSQGKDRIPFDEWYIKWGKRNWMINFILRQFFRIDVFLDSDELKFDLCARLMSVFDYVGDVRKFRAHTQTLFKLVGTDAEVGRTNVSGIDFPQYQELTQEIRDWITEDSKEDFNLYQIFAGRGFHPDKQDILCPPP